MNEWWRIRFVPLLAFLVAAVFLLAPAPALAQGTVRVEVYVGGVAACGVGFFIYFAQGWEVGLAQREPGQAFLNLRGDRLIVAPPLSGLRFFQETGSDGALRDNYELELFRWRF